MEKQQLADIGDRLRQRRNALGLTREQFAELADIGAGYYGQLEVGTSQMSLDTLLKLSHASRLSTDYILFGEPYEKGNMDNILSILENCSKREQALAEQMLKLFLLKY